jgi:RNA polymerase sigma-70 factor (ECF subfamily)
VTSDLDEAAAIFAGVRPRLFGIAYRMLGSSVEAEDIVQDVWIRWQAYDRTKVIDPAAFLATTTTRLAINAAQSARVRRETYIGPWLPEPVDTSNDPLLGAERDDALEFALLHVLEKLSPTQRAAYVLREAFDYPYDEIAEILQLSEANVRQLVSRSHKRLATERRDPVGKGEHRRLLQVFLAAARKGDLSALEELLTENVVSYSDGGGVVRASKFPVVGRTRVAAYLKAFAPRFWPGTSVTWIEANGRPAALVTMDNTPVVLLSIAASEAGIDRLLWTMNPAKLTGFTPEA